MRRLALVVMALCIVNGMYGNELKGKVDSNPDRYSKRELEAIQKAGFDPHKTYVSDVPAPASNFELGKWKGERGYGSDHRYLPNLYHRWNCYFYFQSGDDIYITCSKPSNGNLNETFDLKINQDWPKLLQLERGTPIYIEFHGTDGDWEITYIERIDGIVTKHCTTCTCF